ncbi:interferon regulatory factor 9 [Cynoglossus semilaevis]|uniref:Interferon regulatory factor 9 n=1 Tax=Cynoglossus semilaevis TaxID=244447 RepID=A0A3P8WBU0_CYNSE|nr:interferon regulatory factor 9 [Cynoglossus semilaevis]
MAAGRMRCTRRLRSWIVEQVSSGKYPGLQWDDEDKTMFRIPWKHAGKQDFRKDEDAAIFKAWAEFKGKLRDGVPDNPASWKTRLRCALNKSPEFKEVTDRGQLDISEPYKVYRLIPISEQGLLLPEKKSKDKRNSRQLKRRRRRRSSSSSCDSESEEVSAVKHIKKEETEEEQEMTVTPQLCVVNSLLQDNISVQVEETVLHSTTSIQGETVDEITLDVRIQENLPQDVQDSFNVAVLYLGQEVLRRHVQGKDVRIKYLPSSLVPPTPSVLKDRFPPIHLPEPPSTLPAGEELQGLHTLLPFMEKGVVLTSTHKGVYAKRYCQGRVFWTGPHTNTDNNIGTSTVGLQKMERNTEPVLLFSRDAFKQQLDQFYSQGGEPPECGVTLCFGEELSNNEDLSKKLIIVKITFPWAEQKLQETQSVLQSINFLQSLASQSPIGEITLELITL